MVALQGELNPVTACHWLFNVLHRARLQTGTVEPSGFFSSLNEPPTYRLPPIVTIALMTPPAEVTPPPTWRKIPSRVAWLVTR